MWRFNFLRTGAFQLSSLLGSTSLSRFPLWFYRVFPTTFCWANHWPECYYGDGVWRHLFRSFGFACICTLLRRYFVFGFAVLRFFVGFVASCFLLLTSGVGGGSCLLANSVLTPPLGYKLKNQSSIHFCYQSSELDMVSAYYMSIQGGLVLWFAS